MTEHDKCDACTARVEWREHTRTGKAALVNVEPDPAGNVVLVGPRRYAVLTKKERAAPAGDVPRHTLHFATCPAAVRFRKPKR